jgi:HEAT repeat protein
MRRACVLLVVAAVAAGLAAGGYWMWFSTPHRVNVLLDQVRGGRPKSALARVLAKLHLSAKRDPRAMEDVQEDLARLGPQAVPYLIEALSDPDWSARQASVGALRMIGRPEAAPPLAAALLADNNSGGILEALEEIDSPDTVALLPGALKNASPSTRYGVADFFGRLCNSKVVAPLVAALGDEDPAVRMTAAKCLGRAGDARAIGPLLAMLKAGGSQTRAAAEALGDIGTRQAVSPLVRLLQDRNCPGRRV